MAHHRWSAFQLGCDARYAGVPVTLCPYDPGINAQEWTTGWYAVDQAIARVTR